MTDRQQETIDAVWPIAKAVGLHMQQWHDGRDGSDAKYFHRDHWDGDSYIAVAFAEPGTLEFRLNKGADVRISNMVPQDFKPEDIEIGPITPTGEQKVLRADIFAKNNRGWRDMERELKYRDLTAQSQTDTVANEVSVGMAAEFEQSLGYGSEVAQIQGETRFKVSFEAAFRRAWDTAITRSRENEMESVTNFIEPALHRTVIERIEQVGPARQVIKATGNLTFGCRVHSSGHWWKGWNTMDDFIACLQGVENKSEDPHNWLGYYRNNPVPRHQLAIFKQPVHATVEKVREFQEAHNVEVEARFEPLSDKAPLHLALQLVQEHAEQTDNDELNSLVSKELKGLK